MHQRTIFRAIAATSAFGLSVVSLAALSWLAREGYVNSKRSGAEAAQGDLGFFLLLIPASLAVTVVLGVTWWVCRTVLPGSVARTRLKGLLFAISAVNVLALAWNWIFLWFFWGPQ